MARCPFTAWHPLGDDQAHQPLMSRYDGIGCHTAVGALYSTFGYFAHGNGEAYVGTESHWIVGAYGEGWQITDTARTADAGLEGNPRMLWIEFADSGEGFPAWDPNGSNVPAFRPEQIVTGARIIAWASKEHNFPIQRMPNSLSTTRGVGYHRLGIDPWRVSGGESWSTSGGKVCPGDRRVAQMDEMIALAKNGAKPPWPEFRETSPAVRAMVTKLDAGGYFPGPRRDKDGYYGAFTKAAIKKLQLAHDDTKGAPDGLIGPLTWKHIEALPDAPPPPQDPNKPLAEAWQRACGDTNRASGLQVAAGDAFVTAHPKMPLIKALYDEQVEALHANQIRWQRLHALAT